MGLNFKGSISKYQFKGFKRIKIEESKNQRIKEAKNQRIKEAKNQERNLNVISLVVTIIISLFILSKKI